MKGLLVGLLTLLSVSICWGETREYVLNPDQSPKSNRDDVEVNVTVTETFVQYEKTTAGELKAIIERLERKLVSVAAHKAKVEADLAEVEKEAAKFELEK